MYIIYIFRTIVLIFVAMFIQRFGRCTLRPSSGGGNLELNPLFRLPGLTFLVPRAMFNGCQLSVISY